MKNKIISQPKMIVYLFLYVYCFFLACIFYLVLLICKCIFFI